MMAAVSDVGMITISRRWYAASVARQRSGPPRRPLPVNRVRPLLERRGKTRERRVEHRAHQHCEHPALELIGEEETDVAGLLILGLECPLVFHLGDRPTQITHRDFQVWPV